MRVLLINPEFPPSFWSLAETNKFMGRKTLLPPLGLLTVAALLPQEWEFHLADLNIGALTAASWQWADLVMITGMIIQREGILRLVREANGTRTLELSDGVVSRVTGDGHRTVHQQGRILVDGTDVCVPALWRPHREMIAYSVAGYSQREWEVPPDWHDVKRADLYQVGSAGLSPAGTVELRGHRVSLTLRGGQMMSVVPAGTAPESLQARGESSCCADRSEMKQSKQSGVLRS